MEDRQTAIQCRRQTAASQTRQPPVKLFVFAASKTVTSNRFNSIGSILQRSGWFLGFKGWSLHGLAMTSRHLSSNPLVFIPSISNCQLKRLPFFSLYALGADPTENTVS
ncbi:uncharacterized protein LOC111873803 [Cryptotermes secundus]|uniref:uncharacterized protein LOC111873803 n=1 Tax=Cryptotermes secundus TaxID=105785 RepID=UPI001454D6A2|nr:uncharacterized protein LOC111873803 [Cryptotermes secundus]